MKNPDSRTIEAMGRGIAVKGALRADDEHVGIERVTLASDFDEVARQVWIPRWRLPPGVSTVRPILPYPAVNIAIEPELAAAYLPAKGRSERVLTGSGWAAGLLLRPGAGGLLIADSLAEQLSTTRPIPSGETLVARVRDEMARDGSPSTIAQHFQQWLEPLLAGVDTTTRLVNAICDAVETDTDIKTTAELVVRFGLSERALQRLLRQRVGFSPRWLIQRRRLQEAAYRLRDEPDLPLAELAAELGYADQPHFTREFTAVVGTPPGGFRQRALDPVSTDV